MSLPLQQLQINVNKSPEALERILRVVRHRGFKVELLHWKDETSQLLLTVSSERSINLLTTQLAKLFDVTNVINLSDETQSKSA